ncbi:MAG: bactofilin family protein [Bacillota bacterium]
MLGKKQAINVDKMDTLIGKETMIAGKITANGTLRIDGRVEGEVLSQGDVIIGEGAKVQASVQARNLLVAGELKGNVAVSGRVEMAATSKLEGDIQVGTLIVEDGALFLGSCTMQKDKTHGGKPSAV